MGVLGGVNCLCGVSKSSPSHRSRPRLLTLELEKRERSSITWPRTSTATVLIPLNMTGPSTTSPARTLRIPQKLQGEGVARGEHRLLLRTHPAVLYSECTH